MAATFSVCDEIISNLRSSNLNFSYQETPFSLYVTVRKTLVKYQHQNQNTSNLTKTALSKSESTSLEEENMALKSKLKKLESEVESSKATTTILEDKLGAAETESLKLYHATKKWEDALAQKDDEVKILKNVIKKNNCEISKLEMEQTKLMKTVKNKDKEMYDLEKMKLTHQNTIKTLKDEAKKLKSEKSHLEKNTKNMEKKVKSLECKAKKETSKKIIEPNNNQKLVSQSLPAPFSVTSGSSSVFSSSSLTTPIAATFPCTSLSMQTKGYSSDKSLKTSSVSVSTLPASMVSHMVPSMTCNYIQNPVAFSSMVSHYVKLYPHSASGITFLSKSIEEALERYDRQFKDLMKEYFGQQ